MSTELSNGDIRFEIGEWVLDTKNPGRIGQYTGRWKTIGNGIIMLYIAFQDGNKVYRPMHVLDPIVATKNSVFEKMQQGYFGKINDLRRLITYEKLKGALQEVIYSMDAAQIDFYPYQFKPVIKFINAPTERLIVADEVGLGKTIESGLIWMELQARRQARRLLVVCPKTLANKWEEELRVKFLIDARVVNFADLKKEVDELKRVGPSHSFILIATYSGIRPPKPEIELIKEPPDIEKNRSSKTIFLQELKNWPEDFPVFDLVVFDEAHYMRNSATTTFHLGKAISDSANAVLCVSATPVNNSNTDLHSLLQLIDEDFFETKGMFEELLNANKPAVQASNALARNPVDIELLQSAVMRMKESPFIKSSQLFENFLKMLETLNPEDQSQIAKCQDIAEKLNLIGNYINRTRRVQVHENRPIREATVLYVEYSKNEMALYRKILTIVRSMCKRDSRSFHMFQVMGLQLRAASCLPVIAEEIRSGKFGDLEELISESIGDLDYENNFEGLIERHFNSSELLPLLNYDFEKNDSKYKKLKKLFEEMEDDEKILIFAYYRPTLEYLERRLVSDGYEVTIIHGGIANEKRWEELERFKDPKGPKALLSSEVGSEGIDLQFCRVLVNYDLPWNPMRVEQRIGRIDRVGQKAKKMNIINFKVHGTIEEKIYEKLYLKLEKFKNSLGDIESLIGKKITDLSYELLSKDLNHEQEKELIIQSQKALEQKLIQIQDLEESSDALVALSDYIQEKIQKDRDKGRYIQYVELEEYLIDFFERNFQGCEVKHHFPKNGCFGVSLTPEAYSSLFEFIRDDRSVSANPFRQKKFKITFRREVYRDLPRNLQSSVHFVNHLSPLIRWITKINKDRAYSIYNVSALELRKPILQEGMYYYLIEKWKFSGLSSKENLAYAVVSLDNNIMMVDNEAEELIQYLLRQGQNWINPYLNNNNVKEAYNSLEASLSSEFDDAVLKFQAENDNTYKIKAQRIENFYNKKIAQDEKRINTLIIKNQGTSILNMAKKRLQNAQENKQNKLNQLSKNASYDFTQETIAAGVFRVIPK